MVFRFTIFDSARAIATFPRRQNHYDEKPKSLGERISSVGYTRVQQSEKKYLSIYIYVMIHFEKILFCNCWPLRIAALGIEDCVNDSEICTASYVHIYTVRSLI